MDNLNADIRWFVDQYAEIHGCPKVVVGFADLTSIENLPHEQIPYTRAISVAIPLNPEVVSSLKNGANKEYFQEYMAVSKLIDLLEKELVFHLKNQGFDAITLEDAKEATYGANPGLMKNKDVRHSLSQRTIAAFSGIGWVGKSGLIITKHFGAAVLLATVLTDAPLECSTEVFLSRCSRCMECITACPADAINNIEWSPVYGEDEMIDVEACKQECHSKTLSDIGMEADICGVCVYACPYTKSFLRRNGLSYE